jgi:flagellar hook-basal body complex protein FliE
MCDILIEFYGYTADSLYNESSRNKIGSHDFIINKTFQNLAGRSTNYSENQQFKRNIEDFKRKRVDADYKDCIIDQTKSSVSIQLAKKINSKLAQVFIEVKK